MQPAYSFFAVTPSALYGVPMSIRVTTLPLTTADALAMLRPYTGRHDQLAEAYRQVRAFRVPAYAIELAIANLQEAAIEVFGHFLPPADQLTLAHSLGLRSGAAYLQWRAANQRAACALESALARA